MAESPFNPALIRVVLIVLFLLLPYILRAFKTPKAAKPEARVPAGKSSGFDLIRELKRQAAEQALARQGKQSVQEGSIVEAEPPQLNEQFQQPPTIQPESSFIPSALLLALVACLCLMAYRYWAG